MGFQVADTARKRHLKRTDHIWAKLASDKWVCVLCGALVDKGTPPEFPTREDWAPAIYLPLTEELRSKTPFTDERHLRGGL